MPNGDEKAKSGVATTLTRAQASPLRSRTGVMKALTSLGSVRNEPTLNSCAEAVAQQAHSAAISSAAAALRRGRGFLFMVIAG